MPLSIQKRNASEVTSNTYVNNANGNHRLSPENDGFISLYIASVCTVTFL